MRSPENVLESLKSKACNKSYKYERLYRNLYNPQFYLLAYQRIQAKPGNMTAGTDGRTIDGMGMARINTLIEKMRDFSYQPNPARRTYIPKSNGKMRPLGIPSFDDILLATRNTRILYSVKKHGITTLQRGGKAFTITYESIWPFCSRLCGSHPMSMIETLQEATYQQMQAETSQMTASSQLPEAQEQALDEYPMPDEQVSTPDMQEYGYFYDGMLPVTRERALELDAAGLTVYVLHEDNTESMVFDSQEIMDHGGLFGVDREEWEKSPQFHEKVMERQEHQQEREQAFLSQNRDCFAIYQVSRDDPQNVRFMNLDWLKSHNISIDRSNYDLIYTAPLRESGTVPEQLEKLYQQFNLEKPVDFHSPSMSVSDIVAIKQDGKVSCHYCDSVGFTQIPGFLPENPLKNAEMAVEDDYGMIDGIINNGAKEPTVAELEQQARSGQSISLMDLAAAAHREEREKKKSVMEQLKSQPKAEHKKTAPKKSAEREI